MSIKQRIIDDIIATEGGYVDDAADSGGATNFGITEAVARAAGYKGSMRELPRSLAVDIYADKYWTAIRGDSIELLSDVVAAEVVDTAVNLGPRRAAKMLQRCLNIFNQAGQSWSDIAVDGRIGHGTLNALRHYLDQREAAVLVRALNCLQGAFYIELAERREKDEKFVYGWLSKRVGL